ncbi:MAG: hypothetical protein JRH15_15405 [Deltaproteobacteria bacterium]|nr:hypothetical protein [Deltaproteobacteria bacterium]
MNTKTCMRENQLNSNHFRVVRKSLMMSLLALLFFTAAVSASQDGVNTGNILSDQAVIPGTKAPSITYQDDECKVHQVNHSADEINLIVFSGRQCAPPDSPLVLAGKELNNETPAVNLVEISCIKEENRQTHQDCVLKRAQIDTRLLSLCDSSGQTKRKFAVSPTQKLFLVKEGIVIKTGPYSQLDSFLDDLKHLVADKEVEDAHYD